MRGSWGEDVALVQLIGRFRKGDGLKRGQRVGGKRMGVPIIQLASWTPAGCHQIWSQTRPLPAIFWNKEIMQTEFPRLNLFSASHCDMFSPVSLSIRYINTNLAIGEPLGGAHHSDLCYIPNARERETGTLSFAWATSFRWDVSPRSLLPVTQGPMTLVARVGVLTLVSWSQFQPGSYTNLAT